jgi:hypothetical protein
MAQCSEEATDGGAYGGLLIIEIALIYHGEIYAPIPTQAAAI